MKISHGFERGSEVRMNAGRGLEEVPRRETWSVTYDELSLKMLSKERRECLATGLSLLVYAATGEQFTGDSALVVPMKDAEFRDAVYCLLGIEFGQEKKG